jgi:hypothetical protein
MGGLQSFSISLDALLKMHRSLISAKKYRVQYSIKSCFSPVIVPLCLCFFAKKLNAGKLTLQMGQILNFTVSIHVEIWNNSSIVSTVDFVFFWFYHKIESMESNPGVELKL